MDQTDRPDDPRLAHGFPPTANLPSKESRSAEIRNPKMQENPDPPPAFLQNRILDQLQSQRQINRFRILHGRLLRDAREERAPQDEGSPSAPCAPKPGVPAP